MKSLLSFSPQTNRYSHHCLFPHLPPSLLKKTHLYTAFSSLVAMTSRHKQPSPDQRPQQHPNSTKDDGGDQ